MISIRTAITTSVLAFTFAAGMLTEWKILKPAPLKPEPPAAAVWQADGSQVLERRPDPAAQPRQLIPQGGKVERIVQVTVQPSATQTAEPRTPGSGEPSDPGVLGADTAVAPPPAAAPCPPVTVDLSLVRMPDLTRRVIASSPDGMVVGGVDIPMDTQPVPKVMKWAVGAVYGRTSLQDKSMGIFVDRDLACFRAGAEVVQVTSPLLNGRASWWDARLKFGLRF